MIKTIIKQATIILLLSAVNELNAQCSLNEVPLSKRINSSDLIIEGKVISKESYWGPDHGMIYTSNTIEVYKVFKGSLVTTSINIITEGGTVGFKRISADPGLELSVGDVGIFTNISNKFPVQAYPNNVFPHYNSFAGVQGYIRYDQVSGVAADPFHVYSNIDKQLYQVITNQTQQAYTVLKPFSVNNFFNASAKFMTAPSISNFNPSTITAGTKSQLTITGTNFGSSRGSGTVNFKNGNDGGSTTISPIATQYISWSDTQIIVEVPSNAGTGSITVTQSGTSAASSTLTVSYAELNATYDPGTGTQKYKTRHKDDNGSGGYTWRMNTAFDANASAKASFTRAFDTWRCGTGINWVFGSTSSVDKHLSDGINIVTFDDNDNLPDGVLGTCYSYWSTCDGNDWFVSELDIVFENGSYLSTISKTWQYGPSLPAGSEYDFETVAVHELGHGHQLAHVISGGAIMHWAISNGSSNRSLGTNDQNAGNDVQSRSTAGGSCGAAMTSYTGCGTPPVSNFTSNKSSVCMGGSVNYFDQSSNSPTSWSWTFSGGTPGTSTSQNPSVTYNTAGTYTVTLVATNSNGSNTKTVTNYITVNSNPSASSSVTNITCNGLTNGSASVSAGSGTSPYTYLWSNGSAAITTSGLSSATYTCTVTDNKGCTKTTTAAITQPSALSISLTPTAASTCSGSDGSISSSVSGGTPAYAYAWQGGGSASSKSGLVAGTYSLTVTDNKGCTKSASAVVNGTGCPAGATKVAATYCGATFTSLSQVIYCDPVNGASNYEYRFINSGTGYSQTVTRESGLTDLTLNVVPGLKYGLTYNVDVRSYVGGSWASYGTVCTITMAGIPATQLASGSCGATFTSLFQDINCNAVWGASNYEYRFVNSGTGYSQTVTRESGLTDISLYVVPGLKYGLTYTVDVRAYAGGSWGSYGTTCTVTIASLPTTKVAAAYCGSTLSGFGQVLYCDAVAGASNYEYRVSNSGLGYSQTYQRQSGVPDFYLYWFSGLIPGTTYSVEVRAYVGGTWGSYGTACNITTASVPNTKVAAAYCGSTVSGYSQALYCDQVSGASNYEYRVTNSGLGYSQTSRRESGLTDFYIGWFPGILPGTSYNVEVRAYVGGGWGSFGTICSVTTTGGYHSITQPSNPNAFPISVIKGDIPEIRIYPNPVSVNNTLSVDLFNIMAENSEATIKVYDIVGKEILLKSISQTRIAELFIDDRFKPGLYFIEIIAGNQKQNKRIMIQ